MEQYHNTTRLVILTHNYLERQRNRWMAISHLLKYLTATTSRIEARAALDRALQEGILEPVEVPSRLNPAFYVNAVKLEASHPEVSRILEQWKLLQYICSTMLRTPLHRQKAVEEITKILGVSHKEALAWVQLLIREGLVIEKRDRLPDGEPIRTLELASNEDEDKGY